MKKKWRGELFIGCPVRVRLISKTEGRLVIEWPDGIPIRLSSNIAKLVLYHAVRSREKGEALAIRDGRVRPYRYLCIHRRGASRENVERLAKQTLDVENLIILHHSLRRRKKHLNVSEIDIAICILSDEGKLINCTQDKARKLVRAYLREHGFGNTYTVTLDTYRKHVKRLQYIGLKLRFV